MNENWVNTLKENQGIITTANEYIPMDEYQETNLEKVKFNNNIQNISNENVEEKNLN